MPDAPPLEIVSEKIPHFWFDVIGRIIPGAFLLGGIAEMQSQSVLAFDLTVLLTQSATVLVVGLFLFIVASYIAGFLLASLSFWVVERPMECFKPINLADIPDSVKEFAQRLYGSSRPLTVRQIRDSCGNFIWTRPEALQISVITSKRDAETLASRSLALSALCLIAINVYSRNCGHVVVLLLVFFAALLSFHHYFQRAFSTRFDATAILLEKAGSSSTQDSSRAAK